MKRRISLIALFITGLSGFLFAQQEEPTNYISKGNWMLGGTMSLTTPDDFIRKPNFSISPMAGFFITNRLALGLEMGYSAYQLSYTDPITFEENTRTMIQVSSTPFARYYF